jgi:small subunit ribosomal protein S16
MSVKIRLSRGGKKSAPFYSIVVANSTSPRDGKFIEKIGYYNPIASDNSVKSNFDEDLVKKWLKNGATPTERVAKILSTNENLKPLVSSFIGQPRQRSTKNKQPE